MNKEKDKSNLITIGEEEGVIVLDDSVLLQDATELNKYIESLEKEGTAKVQQKRKIKRYNKIHK